MVRVLGPGSEREPIAGGAVTGTGPHYQFKATRSAATRCCWRSFHVGARVSACSTSASPAVLMGLFPQPDRGLFERTHVRFYAWQGWVELLVGVSTMGRLVCRARCGTAVV